MEQKERQRKEGKEKKSVDEEPREQHILLQGGKFLLRTNTHNHRV